MRRSWKILVVMSMLLLSMGVFASVTTAQEPQEGWPLNRRERREAIIAVIAETLGLSSEALKTDLRVGHRLTEIAEAQGVSRAEIIEALYTYAVEQVDMALSKGKITQERADQILNRLTKQRDACLNEGNCILRPD